MLLRADRYVQLDGEKLMDLYREGNVENTTYFYPEMDPAIALKRVEQEFLAFLRDDFLPRPENTYWLLVEDGVYKSALQLTELKGRLFYLEALETRIEDRQKGYATELLQAVCDALKDGGPFRICDCVGKSNAASIRTHLKAGFRIVSEAGYDYLQKEADERHYGLSYRWPET